MKWTTYFPVKYTGDYRILRYDVDRLRTVIRGKDVQSLAERFLVLVGQYLADISIVRQEVNQTRIYSNQLLRILYSLIRIPIDESEGIDIDECCNLSVEEREEFDRKVSRVKSLERIASQPTP